ncbi:ribonuclease R [Wenjunlia tyrosinilytica]|uniref:Ribonuclease R n=2 Tax=Wenjunlia tyrosinilytica TaxID=1544741 RepID=A0A917ZC95_9ACTN|nr:RNB domain-containing ribonuclease [Wenjunlia tyrosinilytica]GGO80153.1 ribonuclease R [Wenjunlia tyrosinilytica]
MHVRTADGEELRAALRALRAKMDIPGSFPADALAEAEKAAVDPRLPSLDATDIPLFTIDPPDSTDLDQAMHLARNGSGYRVHYAIADIGAFLTPGGALDAEAHRRGTTLYFPDRRVPLHPPVLSEGAASLLPGTIRPALLWRLDLDSSGEVTDVEVRRALVRSRAKLDYAGTQEAIDSGTAEEPVTLLRTIGTLREELERERGGISLNLPEQEIVERDGGFALEYRAPLPADGWNAQISLMTGMAAADLMTYAGIGILRTLPAPHADAVQRLERVARALNVDWAVGTPYTDVVRSLNPSRANHAAFMQECATLLRGAGYAVFPNGSERPAWHAAVADAYAHCTAPLRRLVDRFTGEICVAACAGIEVPEWVRADLAGLPKIMESADRRAGQVERGCVELVEAAVLADRVGEVFDAVVVDVREKEPTVGTVQLHEPAVIARVESPPGSPGLPLGRRLRVRLTEADPARPKVLFAPA